MNTHSCLTEISIAKEVLPAKRERRKKFTKREKGVDLFKGADKTEESG